jgi:hypothetical protein
MIISLMAVVFGSPVVSEYSGGVVDWEEGVARVRVVATPNTNMWSDQRATEQDARGRVALQIAALAELIPYDGSTTGGDLISGTGEVAEGLNKGLLDAVGNWRVVESIYYTDGRVELVGELNLFEWFSPVAVSQASADGERPEIDGRSTGVIIDARTLSLEPSYSPSIVGSNNSIVYNAEYMSPASSAVRPPVRWNSDVVGSSVISLVGDSPLLIIARDVDGDDIVVSDSDAARLRAIGMGTRLLQEGRVVVLR